MVKGKWKLSKWGLLLTVLALIHFIKGSDAERNGKGLETVKKIEDEIYSLTEKELLKRISKPNETLFEKEANQIFIKFLIDLVKEDNTKGIIPAKVSKILESENYPSFEHEDLDQQQVQSSQVQPQPLPEQQIQQEINQGQQLNQQQQQEPIQGPLQGATQGQQYPEQQFQQGINQGIQQQFQQGTNQGQQFQQGTVAAQNQGQQFQQGTIQNQGQQFQQQQVTVPSYPYPYPEQYPTKTPESFAEVDKLIQQIFRLNITGVLDQSLSLVGSNPVRNLGSGVLKLVFCDPISRLLGRCRGNDTVGRKMNLNLDYLRKI